MAGASRRHNLASVNFASELREKLRQSPCEVYISDMRVGLVSEDYCYPNITIVCDTPQFGQEKPETLLNPQVVIEILSPSTEARDRGEKFQLYRTISSLQDYILVNIEKMVIEVFSRQGSQWLLSEYLETAENIYLPSLDIYIALAAIYEKISFPAEDLFDKTENKADN